MKRSITLIMTLLLLPLLCVAEPADSVSACTDSVLSHTDNVATRKKVAVVLSGGGAYGAMHVGALRVLEQAGLPIDMLVGTSMGSIVGALYSAGYTCDDIATMFRTTDWGDLFLDRADLSHLTLAERDAMLTYIYEREFYIRNGIDPEPGGVIRGNNIEALFSHYLHEYRDSINFLRDMPRQFACVASDLVGDTAVVLTSGSLVKSIRASMSIPGVFTPVRTNDWVLVDGGVKNNFAADVARKLGADIVVGVKFDLGMKADSEYRSLMDVMERSAGSDVSRRARENERYCDLVIQVPVRGFTSGSFTTKALNTLMERGEKAAMEKIGSIDSLVALVGGTPVVPPHPTVAPPTTVQLSQRIDVDNTIRASLGLRFDSEDLAAAQFCGRYYMPGAGNKELALTVRLGLRSMLRTEFYFEPLKHTPIGASYEVWYKRFDIYTRGKHSNTLSALYQRADLRLLGINAANFNFEVGLGWQHYHLFDKLWNDNSEIDFVRNEHYFDYHAMVRYDSEDNRYFPRRGVRAEAKYSFVTSNFAKWHGHSGISDVQARIEVPIPITASTRLIPRVHGRLLFGDELPQLASNVLGGMTYGRYFAHQQPMPGMGHVEFVDSKLVGATLRLQQRIVGRHYLLLDGGVAEHNSEMKNLFDEKAIWGAQIAYFYNNNIVGPMGATLGWNSRSHRVNFFVTVGFDF